MSYFNYPHISLYRLEQKQIQKKGNKITFRRSTDFGTAILEIEAYNTGCEVITQSIAPSYPKKYGHLNNIVKMKKSGMKQKDIAFKLGISESYITKLLKGVKY